MANKKPFFISGSNAKILLNGKVVAFATDVSYRITVKHASPRLLGKFEVEEHQPLAYDISGSMSIIRYARGLDSFFGSAAPNDVSDKGNGIGSFGQTGGSLGVQKALGLPNGQGVFDGNADENLNPGRMHQAKGFDIEIRQVIPNRRSSSVYSLDPIQTVRNLAGVVDDLLVKNPTNAGGNETSVVLLRGCRIVDMGFSLSRKGVAIQQLGFVAQYADDDTMIAATSGVGQEFS